MSMQTKSQSKNQSFRKSTGVNNTLQQSSHKDNSSNSNRPSLLGSHGQSLSQVTGINHLNDKRNSGLLLYKNQATSSMKKDNKIQFDYYTVQNNKNQPSSQSNLPTARQQNSTSNNKQLQLSQQNSAQKNTTSTNQLIVNVSSTAVNKQHAQIALRNSIKTEQRKQRAISSTKQVFNNLLASQNNTQQNFSSKIAKKGLQITNLNTNQISQNHIGFNNKSTTKHSLVIKSNLAQSPIPLPLTQQPSLKHPGSNNLYRSPQHSSKQQNVFSQSNSPVPTQPQVQSFSNSKSLAVSKKNSTKFEGGSLISQSAKNHSRVQNTKASKTITSTNNPSTLQIDLSNLTGIIGKNDTFEEPSQQNHFTLGGSQTTTESKPQIQILSNNLHQPSINTALNTHKQSSNQNQHQNKNTKKSTILHQPKKKTPSMLSSSPNLLPSKYQANNCKSPVISQTKGKKDSNKDVLSHVSLIQGGFDSFGQAQKSLKEPDKKKPSLKVNQKTLESTAKKSTESRQRSSANKDSVSGVIPNHGSESEENNNIPEIQSFNTNPTQKEETIEEFKLIVESKELPLYKSKFLQYYDDKLFNYELEEIKKLDIEKIYFVGQISQRTEIELQALRQNEQELIKGFDDEEGYYHVLLNDHLIYRYEIIKILGKGSFAQVVSCIDHKTGQKVAIKITRNTEIDHKFALSESRLLNYLMKNDSQDKNNIVRMKDEFMFRDHHCFVFELLYSDLFEHLKENGFLGFPLKKIRDYAIQILEALIFLENHDIIHCDLKPENILLTDKSCESIKLVDYGSGCFKNEQVYTYVQSRFYRAPEVILRLQYTQKVDIWSFGCILAELYTGEPLFPGNNEQEQLELIMEVCGIPPPNVIDKSRKKDYYFDVDYSPFLIEDDEAGILRIPESKQLEEIITCQDHLFVDFIKQCIELDPEKRFSAKQAIEHPWLREEFLKKASSQVTPQVFSRQNTNRKREEEQERFEESPKKGVFDIPKKSLSKASNYQQVKISTSNLKDIPNHIRLPDENESMGSTPKAEGGIEIEQDQLLLEDDPRFNFQSEKESVVDEQEVMKPQIHNINNNREAKKKISSSIQLLGSYEIVRDEEDPFPIVNQANSVVQIPNTNNFKSNLNSNTQSDVLSNGSSQLSHPMTPPQSSIIGVTQGAVGGTGTTTTEVINNENQINKITITVYQRRNGNKQHSHQHNTLAASTVQPAQKSNR